MTTRRARIRPILCALLPIALFGPGAPARAAHFQVDDPADRVDRAPGDGACADAVGACTLRAAIQEANALPGADSISVPAGLYRLAIAGRGEDAAATGDLDVTDHLSLSGAGEAATILDADGLDRGFQIANPGAVVSIAALTVQNGSLPFEDGSFPADTGGGLRNDGDLTLEGVQVRDNRAMLGGGVSNFGTLHVLRSRVTGNEAWTVANFLGAGGIGSAGTLVVEETTISGNRVFGTGGGIGSFGPVTLIRSTIADNHADQNGGGVASAFGTLSVVDSTISGNTTNEGGGGISFAGEIVTLENVTLTANVADVDGNGAGDGGGIRSAGVATLANTILAGNLDRGGEAPDCTGGLVSQGHNLIGDTRSCNIVGDTTGDITNADPQLGPRADHGGPTETHAPLPGSPVIDAGSPAAPGSAGACEDTDQRGVARPQDGDADGEARCDIGAFEVQAATSAAKASGGGWLATLEGRKLNFGFHAKQKPEGPEGQLQLHDKAAGVKIHISELSSLGGVTGDCGSVEPGAQALELRGHGRFNGAPGAEFRVCVEDSPDLLYLECLSGCAYDTASRTPDDALDGGNIQVRGGTAPPEEPGGEAAVLVLDPVLLSEAPAGGPQLLTVSAYGADGELLAGAPVTLEATEPGGGSLSAASVTGPLGTALFTLDVAEGESECVVRAGELESNHLELTGTSP